VNLYLSCSTAGKSSGATIHDIIENKMPLRNHHFTVIESGLTNFSTDMAGHQSLHTAIITVAIQNPISILV